MKNQQLEQIVESIKLNKSYLIGVCGIPGAGKSFIAHKLQQKLNNSIIVPLDGFHIYRKDLTAQGHKYRGAAFTFNLQKFKTKLFQIKNKQKYPIYFPSFDHALKDPVEDNISLEQTIDHVIVEGLYVFDKSLNLDEYWDTKIWVECNIQTAIERVAKRHLACQIQPTLELAWIRANENDRKNAEYVCSHSSQSHCLTIQNQ